MNIFEIRKEYSLKALEEINVNPSPIKQFLLWLEEAITSEIIEANAMVLATVDEFGQSQQRSVLLKNFDTRGAVFYTNYKSRKAIHIEKNSRVSLLFPWYALERQVIINGKIIKVSNEESTKYFMTRPAGSRLGALASNQSEVISSRDSLDDSLEKLKEKYKGQVIPKPQHWGGYRVIPEYMEFWQGRSNRLHDRIVYQCNGDNEWCIRRLSP